MKLIPKNWAVFQHYKDRNPPWIKLHRETLNDRTYMTLPLASKALAPLMWLLASESKNGVFNGSADDLMFRLHITKKEYEDGVKPLIDKGFFEIASGVLADCQQDARPETETKKEVEVKQRTKGSRLSTNFFELPDSWREFCQTERPDLNPQKVFDSFKDYWVAKAGAAGVKLDWQATWRNWVRNQNIVKPLFNKADIVHQTVPSSSQRDPALVKLDEDRLKTAPPNPEVLARIRAVLGKQHE
jgi:hypothetical protein